MSQSSDELKEKLKKDFPGVYTVIDEETMKRIKRLKLQKDEEDNLIQSIALLEYNGMKEINELLDEMERESR